MKNAGFFFQSLRDCEKKKKKKKPRSLTLRIEGFDETRGCLLLWRACIRLRDLGAAILLTLQHVRVRAVFVEGPVVYPECAQGRERGELKSIDMVCGVNTRIIRGLKRDVGSEYRVSIARLLRAHGYCGVPEESLNMKV